jgi:hypothetical protein
MEKVDDLFVAKKMLHLSQSANSRGLEFSLSFKTVKRLLECKRCYYTNDLFEEVGLKSRTIDRVDAAIGYLDNNVVACTSEINSKKVNLTIAEIELLFNKIKRFKSGR